MTVNVNQASLNSVIVDRGYRSEVYQFSAGGSRFTSSLVAAQAIDNGLADVVSYCIPDPRAMATYHLLLEERSVQRRMTLDYAHGYFKLYPLLERLVSDWKEGFMMEVPAVRILPVDGLQLYQRGALNLQDDTMTDVLQSKQIAEGWGYQVPDQHDSALMWIDNVFVTLPIVMSELLEFTGTVLARLVLKGSNGADAIRLDASNWTVKVDDRFAPVVTVERSIRDQTLAGAFADVLDFFEGQLRAQEVYADPREYLDSKLNRFDVVKNVMAANMLETYIQEENGKKIIVCTLEQAFNFLDAWHAYAETLLKLDGTFSGDQTTLRDLDDIFQTVGLLLTFTPREPPRQPLVRDLVITSSSDRWSVRARPRYRRMDYTVAYPLSYHELSIELMLPKNTIPKEADFFTDTPVSYYRTLRELTNVVHDTQVIIDLTRQFSTDSATKWFTAVRTICQHQSTSWEMLPWDGGQPYDDRMTKSEATMKRFTASGVWRATALCGGCLRDTKGELIQLQQTLDGADNDLTGPAGTISGILGLGLVVPLAAKSISNGGLILGEGAAYGYTLKLGSSENMVVPSDAIFAWSGRLRAALKDRVGNVVPQDIYPTNFLPKV